MKIRAPWRGRSSDAAPAKNVIGFDGAVIPVRIELGTVEEAGLRTAGQPLQRFYGSSRAAFRQVSICAIADAGRVPITRRTFVCATVKRLPQATAEL